MHTTPFLRNLSRTYLCLVPFVVAIIAFTVGHSSYTIYLPIWGLHACCMILAAWILGGRALRGGNYENRNLALIALFLITPWLFISIFAGMGPLPDTMKGFVDTITEQQIRYIILFVCGILYAAGFALLWDRLKREGESTWSLLGFTGIMIKIPLFIFSMAFLSGFLIESFKVFVASGTDKRPDLYFPLRAQFNLISTVEVSITYLATAAFARSLRKIGWLSPVGTRIYVIFSLLGFAGSLIPPTVTGPLAVAGYLSSIPAFSLIMPYLMGVNFLRRAG